MSTERPVEPGEDFTRTFHVHDTGDPVCDSEALMDGIQFVDVAKPGTRLNPL